MKIISADTKSGLAVVELGTEEIYFALQAVAAICDDTRMDDGEFLTIFGFDRDYGWSMVRSLRSLYRSTKV